jgi:hypothetical protein
MGLAWLVLDDVRIMQVHPKGIAHPTKAFLDAIGGFSYLVEKDASPDSQQVGGILLLLLFGYIRMHGSCRSPEENGNSGASDVGQGIQHAGSRLVALNTVVKGNVL